MFVVYSGGAAEKMAALFVYQEHDSETLWRPFQRYFWRNLSEVSAYFLLRLGLQNYQSVLYLKLFYGPKKLLLTNLIKYNLRWKC